MFQYFSTALTWSRRFHFSFLATACPLSISLPSKALQQSPSGPQLTVVRPYPPPSTGPPSRRKSRPSSTSVQHNALPMSTPTLSAAQRLQQAHEQQSQSQQPLTEDPFPDLLTEDPFPVASLSSANYAASTSLSNGQQQGQQQQQPKKKQVDVSDESAFPSLGGGGGAPKASSNSGWGNNLNKVKSTPVPSPSTPSTTTSGDVATLNFSVPTSSIHIASPSSSNDGRGGRNGLFSNDPRLKSGPPTTLGEVLKHLQQLPQNEGTLIQASSSSKLTTFIIKATATKSSAKGGKGLTAQENVERVKGELLGWLERKVKEEVKVPKGLRAVIIGAKGESNPSVPCFQDTKD